ncbi:Bifunctional polynucleotide phosphatase/kinase [Coccomyxa sp. Obi]|nr:Bifunctional polynucleotide phosphatase/kinase [Coccomyxa sp. Obi]
MPPRKKKAPEVDDDDADEAFNPKTSGKKGDADVDEKPKKRQRVKKEKEPQEIHTAHEGPAWTVVPPSLMYREGEPRSAERIAGFDLDGTLVVTKSGAQFVTNPDDFKFFNKDVPKIVKEYAEKGYKVVIFSNQAGIGKQLDGKMSVKLRQRAENMLAKMGVDATVLYACGKDNFRKPKTGMWDYFVENLNGGVSPDKAECFFVGDAAGRPTDIQGGADSDKKFAEGAGIAFKTPEECFGEGASKKGAYIPPAGEEGENHNPEISAAFEQLADHFAKKGEGFKANALRKSSKIIAAHPAKITASSELKNTAGIGKGSMAYIDEFLQSGTMSVLEEAGGFQKPSATGEGAAKPSGEQAMALKFL